MNKQELQKTLDKLSELQKVLEGLISKQDLSTSTSSQWYEPKKGEKYWLADHYGQVSASEWEDDNIDKSTAKTQQLFCTEEEAKQELKRRKAEIALKKWILTNRGDWEPDWSDKTQKKHSVCRWHSSFGKALKSTMATKAQHHPNWCYMPTAKMAERCAEEMVGEWNVYFGLCK